MKPFRPFFAVLAFLLLCAPLALAQIDPSMLAGGKSTAAAPPASITGITVAGTTSATFTTSSGETNPVNLGAAVAAASNSTSPTLAIGTNSGCTSSSDNSKGSLSGGNLLFTDPSPGTASGPYHVCLVGSGYYGNSPFGQTITITSIVMSAGTLAPSSATIANDMPNQMFVMAIRIPGQVNRTNCSWTGDSAFTSFNWTFPNDSDGRVACEIITNAASPSVGNHTGTVTLGTQSETFTIHVNSGTMTAAPGATNHVSHGQYCCGISGNPPSSFSIGGTYTDGCGNGWGYPSGQNLVTDLHSIVCGLHNPTYSAADWHDAATGGYDGTWLSAWQSLMGAAYAAHQWYSVRLNSEWGNGDRGASGCSEEGGPWYNDPGCSGTGAGPIAVSDWVGAVQRVANVIHNNFPGVVVELDSPYVRGAPPTWTSADVPYAPASLAPYIDIWGVDWYNFTQYLPSTSPSAYQTTDGIGGNGWGEASQPGQVGFAAAMGTEIAMPEWCDEFSDYNPGYMLTRLAYQMIDYGMAYEAYWNSTDAGTNTCPIGNSAGQTAAYNNIFNGWSYSGSFSWGGHTPWVPQ